MNQDKLFNDAVVIVRKELSPETAKIIRYSIEQREPDGRALHQAGFGVAVRNLLAEHGIVWEDAILFSVWFAVLQKAIESIVD